MDLSATILRAIRHGAITANTAESGFAHLRSLTDTTLDDATLSRAISDCLAQKLIHDPVRLQAGALHCHWTLELTATGLTAARALIEK